MQQKTPNATFEDITQGMRRKLGEDYQIDDVDCAILSALMQYPSLMQAQIAKSLGYSKSGLIRRMQKPAFKAALAELRKGAAEILAEAQAAALKRLLILIESPREEIALAAARVALTPLMKQGNLVYTVSVGEGGQEIPESPLECEL